MGDWYEIKFLGDKAYLEACSEQTGWQTQVTELTDVQVEVAEQLSFQHSQEMKALLKGFV